MWEEKNGFPPNVMWEEKNGFPSERLQKKWFLTE